MRLIDVQDICLTHIRSTLSSDPANLLNKVDGKIDIP